MKAFLSLLSSSPIVPIITINDVAVARDVARALLAGGIPYAEVTLRTEASLPAIEAMAAEEGFIVGAGTVNDVVDVRRCFDAGARFIVTPGLDDAVAEACLRQSVPIVPGTATPTEMLRARVMGIQIVKVFPAQQLGGPQYIDAISAPLHDMQFFPSGGVSPHNLSAYLQIPSVFAVGASWIAPRFAIAAGDMAGITRVALDAVEQARAVRP